MPRRRETLMELRPGLTLDRRQAVDEFGLWHQWQNHCPTRWEQLHRDDFRKYLNFLGQIQFSRAAIQSRLSALQSFYQSLLRYGLVAASPLENLKLPKLARRPSELSGWRRRLELLDSPFDSSSAREPAANRLTAA